MTPQTGREIKFRAWQKDDQSMIYPKKHYSPNYKDGHIAEFYNPEENEFHIVYERDDNFILMQFTGLHDKNGKEIWEGDLIKDTNDFMSRGICIVRYGLGEMDGGVYTYPGFYLEKTNGEQVDFTRWQNIHEDFEVVGNIFEHPDLLKKAI